MPDITSIVNTILANGSTEYTSRIPEATRDNIQEVGNAILSYTATANEFLTSLLNKIVMQLVINKTAKNPLTILKKGSMPLGFDIEQSYINPATGAVYDPTGASLLSTSTPDVKTEYFRVNRQDRYKATIYRDRLKFAFTSEDAFGQMVAGIVNSLYSGDFIDEFILMKRVFSDAIVNQKMITASVTDVTTAETALAFVTAVKNLASGMVYPSTAFNAYAKAGGSGNAITTWCQREDQILICRSDILNFVDTNVLAAAFNIDKAQFLAQTLEVDNFGETSSVLAILLDRSAIQVWDKLYSSDEPFYNPEGRYWNYYLHHWQVYALSLMANAVAIVNDAVNPNAPVLTENTLQNGEDDPAGTATTGCRIFFEVWNAEETIRICQHTEIVANNAWTFALDDTLVTGQKIRAWQVDAAGNKSALDTYTVDAGE
jgi:hypothetical protein